MSYDTTYFPKSKLQDDLHLAADGFRKTTAHSYDVRVEELPGGNDVEATFVVQLPVPGCRPEDVYAEVLLQKKVRIMKQTGFPIFSAPFDPTFVKFAGFTVNHGVLALAFKYNVPLELRKQTFLAINEDAFTKEITK